MEITISNQGWEMRIERNPDLPKLGWILQCPNDKGAAVAQIGIAVEVKGEAFVEGCWDGEFGEFNFDNAKAFFGSGVKIVNGFIYVVGSTSLTDRILVARNLDSIYVSNSLICIMKHLGLRLDPNFNYYKPSYAIHSGIYDYDKKINILSDVKYELNQFYFSNILIVRGGYFSHIKRPEVRFGDFKMYHETLMAALRKITGNIKSDARAFRVGAYNTLSAGYDSNAVTALMVSLGVRQTFICRSNKPWIFRIFGDRFQDDGSATAKSLDLPVIDVTASKIKDLKKERLFIAPCASTPETTFSSMFEYIEDSGYLGAVFFGHHGDKVWGLKKSDDDTIKRGGMSGTNLSEARLETGVFQVVPPFIEARARPSISMISVSDEMAPWRIGGNYDRPIPRRIAEEAGIPRGVFGYRKKTSIDKYSRPKNRYLRKSFYCFLAEKYNTNVFNIIFLRLLFDIDLKLQEHLKIRAIGRKINFSYELWFWALKTVTETNESD